MPLCAPRAVSTRYPASHFPSGDHDQTLKYSPPFGNGGSGLTMFFSTDSPSSMIAADCLEYDIASFLLSGDHTDRITSRPPLLVTCCKTVPFGCIIQTS